MKDPLPDRVRVASAQYFVRPVERFEQFADQVTAVVEAAAGYKCRLVVLPEYFTIQLLSLHDTKRPINVQIRDLTRYVPQFVDFMSALARKHGLYIVAGTIPVLDDSTDLIHNDAFFFAPSGEFGYQGKLHMTRFEREEWDVAPRTRMKIFETDFARIAITICYDVEFPELVREVARQGADLLAVPSNTDDRLGFLRVRYCAHARTIENQMYVVHSPTVGGLPRVPDAAINYGQASILTPSDFAFARDGILAQGVLNQEDLIIGELDMNIIDESRSFGTVLPLNDSARTLEIVREIERVVL